MPVAVKPLPSPWQANDLRTKLESLTTKRNIGSINRAEILELKSDFRRLGIGEVNAGGKSAMARLNALDDTIQQHGANIVPAGSLEQMTADLAALTEAVPAPSPQDQKIIDEGGENIRQSAGMGSGDEAKVATLHKAAYSKDAATQKNVTAEADAAYLAQLNVPGKDTNTLGAAQRDVMLAFQVQYPTASLDDFKQHMKTVVGTSTAHDYTKMMAYTGVDGATFSDIAKQAH